MFDIETFQRQCDLLASCTHKRAVLDSVVASLTLIKNSLSSYNGLPLPAVSKVGNDELTYRVVLWVFIGSTVKSSIWGGLRPLFRVPPSSETHKQAQD